MRYCPVCDVRYEEEIIKFCTKDGAPLVDDGKPNFVILPSENAQEAAADFGEETVIRRKEDSGSFNPRERFVIPTASDEEQVRSRKVYYPPPEPPNTGKVIALTILGTLVILSFGAGLFWLFQKDTPVNVNVNTNPINLNADLNTNLGFSSNFNFNTNTNANAYASNYNFNFNFNSNIKMPSMSPTPRQSPTPSVSPVVSPTLQVSPTPKPPASPRPSAPSSPKPTQRPPTMTGNRPAGNG